MICSECQKEIADGEEYCRNCGAKVDSTVKVLSGEQAESGENSIIECYNVSLVHAASLGISRSFSVEDKEGSKLGEAQNVSVLPLKWVITNNSGGTVFILQSVKEKGLLYFEHIFGADGKNLATIKRKSSFLGNKLVIDSPGQGIMRLASDSLGRKFSFSDSGGNVVAGAVHYPGLRESRTDININPDASIDHRIILGSMLYMTVISMSR